MNGFLRKIIGLSLLRMVLDLILPEGDIRRYADLGAGLSITLCLLRTLLNIIRGVS